MTCIANIERECEFLHFLYLICCCKLF